MAVVLQVGDLVEVISYNRSLTQTALNVHHFEVTEVNGGMEDQMACNQFSAQISTIYKAMMPGVGEYLGSTFQVLKPTRRNRVQSNAGQGNGVQAGDILPNQIAGLVALKTNVASKRTRGRKYIPFPGEAASDLNGRPTIAQQTLMQTYADFISTPVLLTQGVGQDCTLQPVIWSRVSDTIQYITFGLARQFWGTMRKRAELAGGDETSPF